MAAHSLRLRWLLNSGVALLLAGTLFLTAHASISARPAGNALPTLRLAYFASLPELATTLDPSQVTTPEDAQTVALAQANLVHILPNGQVAPDLATWTISKNRLVYTFTIRKNARFSSGHYVTAGDAEFSIKRALAPATRSPSALTYLSLLRGARAYNAGEIKGLTGVHVLGTRTLRITITKPAAYFLETLAYPTADVLDPLVVGGKPTVGPHTYLTTNCIGNQGAGPFEFVCRNSSSSKYSFYPPHHRPTYSLIPNPYYYGRKPQIKIELPGLASSTAAYKEYLAGGIEMSPIPTVYLNRWKGRETQYKEYPSSIVWFILPNTHLAPFDNLHCRLAVAYAIDRETIANNIAHGTVHATYAVVPQGMLGYYSGRDNPHYNLSRARSELAQCPGRTTPFVLPYQHSTLFDWDNLYHAIAGSLRSVGMNVKLKPISEATWNGIVGQSLDKTGTQIIADAWQEDYPDPQDYCTLLLRSGQPYNNGGWHNAAYDQLVDRADIEPNPARRAQLYIQAQHIALSQGTWISLSNWNNHALVKPYVHGLVGSEAYFYLVPKDSDWANVSISPH